MPRERIDVAIIGGGVSGSALTIDLAARAPAGYAVALFDRGTPGPGTAYAPQSPSLLLNGPVRAMSAVPGDPRHFSRYLVDEPDDALVCRARYGAYVRATVAAALRGRRDFVFERDDVIDVEPYDTEYRVITRRGAVHRAANVVFALGNFAPGEAFLPRAVRTFAGYARDPWRVDVSTICNGDVALIGSRLTAMDVVALLDERAFPGRVHLISRHGLLPRIERPRVRGLDPRLLGLDYTSPRLLLKTLRLAAASYEGDWRAVVDAIRSTSPAIWSGWSARDRRRFLRHAHAMWAVHRYRVPAATHGAFLRLRDAGRIVNHAGRIAGAHVTGDGIALTVSKAHGDDTIRVAHVVNCTGPESDLARVDDTLVRNVLRRGLMFPDPLRLGVDASPQLRLLDRNRDEREGLYAVGPLLRGLWFEATAVPEIATHAGIVARALLGQHSRMEQAG